MPHFINNRWLEGAGPAFTSTNPATGEAIWRGPSATPTDVNAAVAAARAAFQAWADTELSERIAHLNAFAEQLKSHRADLAEEISREVGKPRWESLTEVDAMINKIPVSIDAYHQRRQDTLKESAGTTTALRFKPHGVVAVFGPFNFPGHLPNGHIVPALLAGNTVVFKPSEQAPLVAQRTAELWQAADLPPGVFNLVQGARDTGRALAEHPDIDGLFFTGSAAVGLALRRALADQPEKILALEMGGNNPLIVHEAANLDAATHLIVQSAFLTSGQRCTCARRLILPDDSTTDAILTRFVALSQSLRTGQYTDNPEPFMGPVISSMAAEGLLASQQKLIDNGAIPLLKMQLVPSPGNALLAPGILDVSSLPNRPDAELFGPLLQVIRVPDFDAALAEANRTAYGLAAGLLSDNRALYERFRRAIRAGVVNWNRPTTGASGSLPFGGIGRSGNNRPSGYFAADYCSYPVASMEESRLALPSRPTPGIPT